MRFKDIFIPLLSIFIVSLFHNTLAQRAPTLGDNKWSLTEESITALKKHVYKINTRFDKNIPPTNAVSLPQTLGQVYRYTGSVTALQLATVEYPEELNPLLKLEQLTDGIVVQFDLDVSPKYLFCNFIQIEVVELYDYLKVGENWLINENTKSLIYMKKPFSKISIPEEQQRQISYSNQIVDNSTVVTFTDASDSSQIVLPNNWQTSKKRELRKLLTDLRRSYINNKAASPDQVKEYYLKIALVSAQLNEWDIFSKSYLQSASIKNTVRTNQNTSLQELPYFATFDHLGVKLADFLIGSILLTHNSANEQFLFNLTTVGQNMILYPERDQLIDAIRQIVSTNKLDNFNQFRLTMALRSFYELAYPSNSARDIIMNHMEVLKYNTNHEPN